MVRSDLPVVVAEHQASPRHGLYARLGPRFLRRYYAVYRRSGARSLCSRNGMAVPWVSLTGVLTPAAHRIALKHAVPALTAAASIAPAPSRTISSRNDAPAALHLR